MVHKRTKKKINKRRDTRKKTKRRDTRKKTKRPGKTKRRDMTKRSTKRKDKEMKGGVTPLMAALVSAGIAVGNEFHNINRRHNSMQKSKPELLEVLKYKTKGLGKGKKLGKSNKSLSSITFEQKYMNEFDAGLKSLALWNNGIMKAFNIGKELKQTRRANTFQENDEKSMDDLRRIFACCLYLLLPVMDISDKFNSLHIDPYVHFNSWLSSVIDDDFADGFRPAGKYKYKEVVRFDFGQKIDELLKGPLKDPLIKTVYSYEDNIYRIACAYEQLVLTLLAFDINDIKNPLIIEFFLFWIDILFFIREKIRTWKNRDDSGDGTEQSEKSAKQSKQSKLRKFAELEKSRLFPAIPLIYSGTSDFFNALMSKAESGADVLQSMSNSFRDKLKIPQLNLGNPSKWVHGASDAAKQRVANALPVDILEQAINNKKDTNVGIQRQNQGTY